MSRRHGWTLIAMGMGWLAPLGCANWQMGQPVATTVLHPTPSRDQAGVPQPAPPVSQPGTEMTPQQSAKLCLAAGEALEKKGYTAEALRQYESARAYDPQLKPVSRRLAVLYDLQGDAARAEAEYQRALNEQPGDAELLNDVGYFHYRHDRVANAETWLRNAVAVDPNCRCAWINLGQVLAKQGRADESVQAFSRVLRPAEAYSNLGVLFAKQGRTAEARAALRQAVSLDPTLKQAQAFLDALPKTPDPLPPGLTRTPQSPAPTSPVAVPTPRIVTRSLPPAPVRLSAPPPAPAGKPTASLPSSPALPSTYNPPVIVTTATPPAPVAKSITPPPTLALAPSRSLPSASPVVTFKAPPQPGRTPPPTPKPAPSPAVPSRPLPVPVVSPKPPTLPPAVLPPSTTSAVPAAPSTPALLPPSVTRAPSAPANGAIQRTSAEATAEPEPEGRSPIVILTDCERAVDGSPR